MGNFLRLGHLPVPTVSDVLLQGTIKHYPRASVAKFKGECRGNMPGVSNSKLPTLMIGSPNVHHWSAQNFVQDVCSQFQLCTSAQTNPTPDLVHCNPNPNPNRKPLGGSRSAGAVTRRTRLRCVFWWRFSKKIPSGRKANLDQNDQHPAQSFAPTSVLLHIGRVLMTNHAYGLIALPERVVCARLPV